MLFLEDTDYCWRLQLAGVQLHFASGAVVHYRFRDTLPGIYRQAYHYAETNVLLYKKYRPLGMPPLSFSWKSQLQKWGQLFLDLRQCHHPTRRAHWAWKLGWQTGRVAGSIKYRTLAF
jgi:GT2 family glycosyltransferase